MLTSIRDYNLQDAFHQVLNRLTLADTVNIGYKNIGGQETKELHPCMVEIIQPQKRTLLYPKRGNNPFATLAETYWILAGRNDVKFLEPFLPRAADFSDDGKVWRAGYGPRLRNWEVMRDDPSMRVTDANGNIKSVGIFRGKVDQLKFVLKQLIKNPASRQAIMSIWDPGTEGLVETTKDWPCSNWIHYMIRNGRLNSTVVMRSNDVIWGWSAINVYEFTVIQEILCRALRVPIGSYFHMSDSMHIYDKSYKKMDELISSHVDYRGQFDGLHNYEFAKPKDNKNYTNPIQFLEKYLFEVEMMCDHLMNPNIPFTVEEFDDVKYSSTLLSMYRDNVKTEGPWQNYTEIMKTIPFSDLKVSCHYWYRKNILKEKDGGVNMILQCITELSS